MNPSTPSDDQSYAQSLQGPPAINLPEALTGLSIQLAHVIDLLSALLAHQNTNANMAHEVMSKLLSTAQATEGLVDGFTSGGASFNAYQVDPLSHAYLTLLGPMISNRLQSEMANRDVIELIKAAIPLSLDSIAELNAYRQQRLTRETIRDAMETSKDPWADQPLGGGLGAEDAGSQS